MAVDVSIVPCKSYDAEECRLALEQALAAQEDALSGLCVVVEDTVDNGGVGEWLASHRSGRTLCISTGNRFLPHGSVNDLYRHCGLAEFVMEHRKETGLG